MNSNFVFKDPRTGERTVALSKVNLREMLRRGQLDEFLKQHAYPRSVSQLRSPDLFSPRGSPHESPRLVLGGGQQSMGSLPPIVGQHQLQTQDLDSTTNNTANNTARGAAAQQFFCPSGVMVAAGEGVAQHGPSQATAEDPGRRPRSCEPGNGRSAQDLKTTPATASVRRRANSSAGVISLPNQWDITPNWMLKKLEREIEDMQRKFENNKDMSALTKFFFDHLSGKNKALEYDLLPGTANTLGGPASSASPATDARGGHHHHAQWGTTQEAQAIAAYHRNDRAVALQSNSRVGAYQGGGPYRGGYTGGGEEYTDVASQDTGYRQYAPTSSNPCGAQSEVLNTVANIAILENLERIMDERRKLREEGEKTKNQLDELRKHNSNLLMQLAGKGLPLQFTGYQQSLPPGQLVQREVSPGNSPPDTARTAPPSTHVGSLARYESQILASAEAANGSQVLTSVSPTSKEDATNSGAVHATNFSEGTTSEVPGSKKGSKDRLLLSVYPEISSMRPEDSVIGNMGIHSSPMSLEHASLSYVGDLPDLGNQPRKKTVNKDFYSIESLSSQDIELLKKLLRHQASAETVAADGRTGFSTTGGHGGFSRFSTTEGFGRTSSAEHRLGWQSVSRKPESSSFAKSTAGSRGPESISMDSFSNILKRRSGTIVASPDLATTFPRFPKVQGIRFDPSGSLPTSSRNCFGYDTGQSASGNYFSTDQLSDDERSLYETGWIIEQNGSLMAHPSLPVDVQQQLNMQLLINAQHPHMNAMHQQKQSMHRQQMRSPNSPHGMLAAPFRADQSVAAARNLQSPTNAGPMSMDVPISPFHAALSLSQSKDIGSVMRGGMGNHGGMGSPSNQNAHVIPGMQFGLNIPMNGHRQTQRSGLMAGSAGSTHLSFKTGKKSSVPASGVDVFRERFSSGMSNGSVNPGNRHSLGMSIPSSGDGIPAYRSSFGMSTVQGRPSAGGRGNNRNSMGMNRGNNRASGKGSPRSNVVARGESRRGTLATLREQSGQSGIHQTPLGVPSFDIGMSHGTMAHMQVPQSHSDPRMVQLDMPHQFFHGHHHLDMPQKWVNMSMATRKALDGHGQGGGSQMWEGDGPGFMTIAIPRHQSPMDMMPQAPNSRLSLVTKRNMEYQAPIQPTAPPILRIPCGKNQLSPMAKQNMSLTSAKSYSPGSHPGYAHPQRYIR